MNEEDRERIDDPRMISEEFVDLHVHGYRTSELGWNGWTRCPKPRIGSKTPKQRPGFKKRPRKKG